MGKVPDGTIIEEEVARCTFLNCINDVPFFNLFCYLLCILFILINFFLSLFKINKIKNVNKKCK